MGILVDSRNGVVSFRDILSAPLSRREFEIFELLLKKRDRPVSLSTIMDHLYQLDNDPPFCEVIRVLISRMRKKIAPLDLKIKVDYGRGYFLEVSSARHKNLTIAQATDIA